MGTDLIVTRILGGGRLWRPSTSLHSIIIKVEQDLQEIIDHMAEIEWTLLNERYSILLGRKTSSNLASVGTRTTGRSSFVSWKGAKAP